MSDREMTINSDIVLYQIEGEMTQIEVRLTERTVWLSLNQIADLFQRHKSVISRHIRNIFSDGELQKTDATAFFQVSQQEGKRVIIRRIEHFNLGVIISVGYRVNSKVGTAFRIWVTKVLKKHIREHTQSSGEHYSVLVNTETKPETCNRAEGYVYLLKSASGYYKIGKTKDPNDRRHTFEVKLPFEVEYVHLIKTPNMNETEYMLHEMFQEKRVNGEWFGLDDCDVDAIKSM